MRERSRSARALNLLRLRDFQNFDVGAVELDDTIVGPERMLVSRPDLEADALVVAGRRVEIADEMNDVVDAARQRRTA